MAQHDRLPDAEDAAPPPIPGELPILPLRALVIFPLTVTPLAVSQPAAIRLIDDATAGARVIGVAWQRDEAPGTICPVGTAAIVHRLLRLHDGTLRIALQGFERIAIGEPVAEQPYRRAAVRPLPDRPDTPVTAELHRTLAARATELLDQLPALPAELRAQIGAADDPRRLVGLIATTLLHAGPAERQALLELPGVAERMERLIRLLDAELTTLRG